jgi:peptidoglycan/LPS O-acetylase OafA/YrhL
MITFWTGIFWEIAAVALLTPLMLLGSVLNPQGYLARALEWAPLRYLGRISYSVYLWQELFFVGHWHQVTAPLGILQTTPLRFAAVLACSMASYHLMERPLIKLGHRMAPPATPGREEIPDEGVKATPVQALEAVAVSETVARDSARN